MGNLLLRLALWRDKKRVILFKEWVEQEVQKEKIIKAVRDNLDEFPTLLCEFVSTALRVPVAYLERLPWEQVIEAFYKVLLNYPIINLPITQATYVDSVSKESWEYDGRTWHYYSHLIAKHYGWTFDYISQLQVQDALATIQEILTDEQLEREFVYSLSEIAYPYDQSTKKSVFKPLPRPPWMRPAIREVPRYKIPSSYMPMGVVDYNALPETLRPKEIQ